MYFFIISSSTEKVAVKKFDILSNWVYPHIKLDIIHIPYQIWQKIGFFEELSETSIIPFPSPLLPVLISSVNEGRTNPAANGHKRSSVAPDIQLLKTLQELFYVSIFSSLQCKICIILKFNKLEFFHISLVKSFVVDHGQIFSWPTCALLCHTSQFRIWYILSIMKCSIFTWGKGESLVLWIGKRNPPPCPSVPPFCHTSQLSPNPSQPFSLISSSFRKAGIFSQFRPCF